jgi:hypothetical protein
MNPTRNGVRGTVSLIWVLQHNGRFCFAHEPPCRTPMVARLSLATSADDKTSRARRYCFRLLGRFSDERPSGHYHEPV